MADADIPPAVRDFVADNIDSVLQLEVLLLLFAQRDREFSAADVSQELRIDASWVRGQLAYLRDRGIVAVGSTDPTDGERYRFWPARPDVERAVADLAATYSQRRVSIVSLIFSKPVDKLRSFADAFRLRQDEPKDPKGN